MDVFELREKLVGDYSSFVESFINIRDRRIGQQVQDELRGGVLWPDPLVQLNPCFEPGESIDELVANGILHSECLNVFRIKPDATGRGKPLRLHRHQAEAVKVASAGQNYILTTGTGSGKSLAYIIPIVDHVLRHGSGKGIQAVIVYPMNALANSQKGELTKFLCHGYPDGRGPVTFARYTGQESDEERNVIIAQPPDILLTNYVMLELILTRPQERNLVRAARTARFLVLDELHTYRGRQGADVAMLIRRTREAFGAGALLHVGTSATLAGGGTWAQQQEEVAKCASLLFGAEVKPPHVIGESLRRVTREDDITSPAFLARLADRVRRDQPAPTDFGTFVADPVATWIESTFGIDREEGTSRLVRRTPRSMAGKSGAAGELSGVTGLPESKCRKALEESLLAGFKCLHPESGLPVFAFRVHQFISRGDTVYASLETEAERHITLNGQQFVPDDRSRALFPVVFCRECGQEYYSVWRERNEDGPGQHYTSRDYTDRIGEDDTEPGYFYASTDSPWLDDPSELARRLPEDWLDERGRIRQGRRSNLPVAVRVERSGRESDAGMTCWFIRAPFRFCLRCGVSYGFRQSSDFHKLSALGSEGRSTATTVLSLSAIRHLREMPLDPTAHKLLSFTDNRQDASLQAGHFNDFIEVGLLRSALFRAVQAAGEAGLRHEALTQEVFKALALPFPAYAANPTLRGLAREETERTFRDVLGYRLYRDLQRGWRIMAPNLEQVGLLQIDYLSLADACQDQEIWASYADPSGNQASCHPALRAASPDDRLRVARVLLDLMRRELAIKVDYLRATVQEQLIQRSQQRLVLPWGLDENEQVGNMARASVLFPRPRQEGDFRGNVYLSTRGAFGQYLRKQGFPDCSGTISLEDGQAIIAQLLNALRTYGLVEVISEPAEQEMVPGYQVAADAMLWKTADGTRGYHDPLRRPTESSEGTRPNTFFANHYRSVAQHTLGIEAREHTAQVPYEQRQQRETRFREGTLPVLFCSPTMELGIDIAHLNSVNMRNVPPTPANYAQRSGRAGRSGQPALVFTYCASGSPHDQYFFKRPSRMVSGAVSPPLTDLANEDLIRAHVQAVWLSEANLYLGSSLIDVLDVGGDQPSLALLGSVRSTLNAEANRQRAGERASRVLATIQSELAASDWYSQDWLQEALVHIPIRFEQACARWRGLYLSAHRQVQSQTKIILDAAANPADRAQAQRLRRDAEAQLDLLRQSGNAMHSDFYSYRYFASEGFLPGYSFPRLPLSAYIPGRRIHGQRDEFLSRPRFLAISEFGPRAVVYHEGSHYIINQVILPVRDEQEELLTRAAKICPACGYLHPGTDGQGPDLCEKCGAELGAPLRKLFRLQSVVTKRRDRINCDEEERLRLGYEIRTVVRFAERGGQPSFRVGSASRDGADLATFSYGNAATLWRINLGRARRKDKDQIGFNLDVDRGYWERNQDETEGDGDPMGHRIERVIPYVEDHRNCLILQPAGTCEKGFMASLQAALKHAIQARYELEDNEIAAEPLPDRDNRRAIMLYEAAEGGAGVLRRILDNPHALAEVAQEALRLCHFDPQTGADLRKADFSDEACEAACYNCLLSYSNQGDHEWLDRQAIKEFLLKLASADVSTSPAPRPRAAHLEQLSRLAGSDLERRWLRFVEEGRLRLPSHAQEFIEACRTRPDFLYKDQQVAVYVDGPPHDFPDRAQRDRELTDRMEDAGWTVLRFHHDGDWGQIIGRYPNVFGDGT